MTCMSPSCVAFREKDPAFAQKLQDHGIIAHYVGSDGLFGGDEWMLDGITPVSREALESLMK